MRASSQGGRIRILLLLALALLLCAIVWRLATWDQPVPRASTGSRAPTEEAEEAPQSNGPTASTATVPQDSMRAEEPLPDPTLVERPPRTPAVLLVRVLDPRGQPAQGASVRIHPYRRSRAVAGGPLAADRADAAGTARFEVLVGDEFGVQVGRDGEVGFGRVAIGTGPNEIVVGMEETLPVVGTVLDREGAPVAGAEVVVSLAGPIRGAESFGAVFQALTDAAGHVPIPRRETAARPYYQVIARGFRTAYGEFERSSLFRDGFEIRLDPLATVTGRFVDSEGHEIPGVIVFVRETMQQASSEPDGRFELPGLPEGGGTLVVEPRMHGRLILRNIRAAQGGTDLGDVVLGPGLAISGRAMFQDGAPACGVYVWTQCEATGLTANAARTDSEGRFAVTGLGEGPYLVTISGDKGDKPGRIAPSAAVPGVSAGTEGLVLVLRPHPALTIQLVSAETGGEAWVLKLEVRATLRGTAQTVTQILKDSRKRRIKDTTLVLDLAGEYDVSVSTPGCPEERLQVTLGPDEWKTVTVRLPRVE